MRVALVGDIVGKPGMRVTCKAVPWLKQNFHVDAIVANAENAADGSGLRTTDYRRLIQHGIDGITLGDHIYRKQEIIEVLTSQHNIVRPANMPDQAPGLQWTTLDIGQTTLGLISLIGRVFMKPADCPFAAADRVLAEMTNLPQGRPLAILVDMHAEATSDKQLMGRFLDGRVSAVLGTHTHVATADQQILPGGTGFQCDVGMTGPMDGILGRKIEPVMRASLHGTPTPFHISTGCVELHATWVDIDLASGMCQAIDRLTILETALDAYLEEQAAQEKARRLML
ncbi:MAG: YmdB family metallophosphoesterase [Pirellulaceae bacterium]|nr:YmdB family metallophosphoesterase [Pirellulaceae bacterium]